MSRLEIAAQEWASEQKGRDWKDYEPDLPPIEGGTYLANDLFDRGEAGASVAGAMGEGPLTHEALRAWMHNTGVRRSPWECRVLIRLSFEYLFEKQAAEKRDAKPPWATPEAKPQKTALQLSIRNFNNL